MADAILGFFDEYRFLSNYHLADVEYEGLVYPSTENAYQAAKTLTPEIRKQFQSPCTPKESKQKGKKLALREDWENIKVDIMFELVQQKFNKHEYLRKALLNTGEAYLEETNWWGDRFWGVCKGTGQNQLGKILMKVREGLRCGDIVL